MSIGSIIRKSIGAVADRVIEAERKVNPFDQKQVIQPIQKKPNYTSLPKIDLSKQLPSVDTEGYAVNVPQGGGVFGSPNQGYYFDPSSSRRNTNMYDNAEYFRVPQEFKTYQEIQPRELVDSQETLKRLLGAR